MYCDIVKRKLFIVIAVIFCSLYLIGTIVHAGFVVSPASFISDLPESGTFSTTVRNIVDSDIYISIYSNWIKIRTQRRS